MKLLEPALEIHYEDLDDPTKRLGILRELQHVASESGFDFTPELPVAIDIGLVAVVGAQVDVVEV